MTLLADLRHLHLGLPNAEVGSHRQVLKVNAFRIDVFREDTGVQRDRGGGAHGVHAFQGQQGNLPVPVPGVGVPHDAVAQLQLNFRYRRFDGSLFLADVDGQNPCHDYSSAR